MDDNKANNKMMAKAHIAFGKVSGELKKNM
jgi:hypothetical protein